jgi:ACS family hexuronate transporter-like MFS transporter
VVGALADTIGFSPLFAVLAVFDLLGAVVIWTVLKSKSAGRAGERVAWGTGNAKLA